jgi:hypothetical protein
MLMAFKNPDVNNVPHVSGRGIRRRKLTRRQRVTLAADLVSGEARLAPSLNQVCELLRIPPVDVRGELKARASTRETEHYFGLDRVLARCNRARTRRGRPNDRRRRGVGSLSPRCC